MMPAARELQIHPSFSFTRTFCTTGKSICRTHRAELRLPPVSLAFARSWVTAVVVMMLTVMLPSCCSLPCMGTHGFATMMILSSLGRAAAPSPVAPALMLVRMPRRAEA